MSKNILEVKNLSKVFPGVKALDGVNFNIKQGEIHCLCGENGAGKSTLMNIISGVYAKETYDGEIYLNDKLCSYKSVQESKKDNIAIIHQELALSPYLSIYENIYLGHMETKMGIINWHDLIISSKELLDKVGLNENPETIVNKIGVGKQQLVEIARALSQEVKLLILDEPTSSLNDSESEQLLGLIKQLKIEGITCIMISHKLNEVLEVADSITILRDGKTICSYDTKEDKVTEEMIIKAMVGRDMDKRYPHTEHDVHDENILEVKDWCVYHPEYIDLQVVNNASFYLKKGEILAFCGPMGAGRTELMMSIFGKSYGSSSSGALSVRGKEVNYSCAKDAIDDGIMYVSEDRKALGLILMQSVKQNISNSNLALLSNFGVIDKHSEINEAVAYKKKLNIKTPSVEQVVETLSGGNQQKVVLSRCLLAQPDILIVDEPTRGIDVGAKYEIYCILKDLAKEGKSVIIVTSEMPEALGMADRIYVMNEGQIKGQIDGKIATQESIMSMALHKNEEK